MTKKSGGDGAKPAKPRRPRAPRKAKAKEVENANIIKLTDADRAAFRRRIKEAAAKISAIAASTDISATHPPARARAKMGRPQHEKTADTISRVSALAAIGTPKELIAVHLGIATETLNKHYTQELSLGFELIGMEIVSKMTKSALDGDFKAQRLWLETHMGWGKRMQRNALPTHVVNAENIPQLPSGPAAVAPGSDPSAPALPLTEKGDYVGEMVLGLDAKDIKE